MDLMINALQASPTLLLVVVGVLGAMVGSFLNVVIYRLPVMLLHKWREESHAILELDYDPRDAQPFNLCTPRSRCGECGVEIKPWHNIPVLSYLLLKGKCKSCDCHISFRYPFVELMTCVLSIYLAWHFGYSWQLAAGLVFTWSLVALFFIDFDTQLLPDIITLPLMWIGLLVNVYGVFCSLQDAVLGAVAGYMILWSIMWLYKVLSGKQGMGHGDFKLLAAVGAWLGWQLLPFTILIAALSGAVIGSVMLALQGEDKQTPIAFGPYICLSAWVALLWGEPIMRAYCQLAGINY